VTTNAIIFLCGAIAAFAVFAIALAYGEYQTRRFKRLEDAAKAGEPNAAKQDWLKAA
jgi:hypothetical protein